MLLNILQCTGQSPKVRITWPEMPIVQSLRNSVVEIYKYYIHIIHKLVWKNQHAVVSMHDALVSHKRKEKHFFLTSLPFRKFGKETVCLNDLIISST